MEELSAEDKSRVRFGFYLFYVFEKHCNDGFKSAFGALYFQLVTNIILLTYMLFSFSSSAIILIGLGSINGFSIAILSFMLYFVISYRLASVQILVNMKLNPSNQSDFDRRLWRSLRPLEFWFGHWFIVEKMEYLLVVVDIIVNTVISLLLTFSV